MIYNNFMLKSNQNSESCYQLNPKITQSVQKYQDSNIFDSQAVQIMSFDSVDDQKIVNNKFSNQELPEERISDDEDSDSAVSFEDEILDPHTFSLGFVLQKFSRRFFKQSDVYNSVLLEVVEAENHQQTFQEYFQGLNEEISDNSKILFCTIISRETKLRKFLHWLYENAPQHFLSQLLYVFQKIVLYFQPMRSYSLQLSELFELAARIDFLRHIYDDGNLHIFNFNNFASELESLCPSELASTPHLMKFFILTILLVLQKFFNHPFQMRIRQLIQQEVQKRLADNKKLKCLLLSKKIRKIKEKSL